MSRPRFLADHDLNEHLVYGAVRRELVIEFIRARDIGMHERPDAEVLAYAAEHQIDDTLSSARGTPVQTGCERPSAFSGLLASSLGAAPPCAPG